MTRTRKNGKNGNNPKKKMRQPKRGYYYQFLIAVAFIVTALCIGTSSFVREVDMIHVGDVALKRYVAPRDAVDEAATEKLRTAAANSVGPIYKNDVIVEETSANEINEVFQALNDVLRTLSDENNFFDEVEEVSLTLPVALTNSQLAAYEGLIRGERLLFAEDCVGILNQIYSEGVTADSLQKGKDMASEKLAETRWADELKEMADALIVAAMEPNLVLDEDAMEVAREQKRVEVADILVRANQKIVDEGEIITQDIYDRLIGLKLIDSADFQNDSLPILGSLILLALVFLAVYLYFLWDNGTRRWKKSEMSLLCTVYVVSILTIRLMSGVTYFTLLPVALFAMLVSLLLQPRTAMILQSAFVISAALIVNGTEEFLIFALISGLFGAIIIRKTEVRVYLMPAALAMAALNFLTMMAVGLFFREGYSHELLLGSAWGALIGLMSVIIVVGSLPFWRVSLR